MSFFIIFIALVAILFSGAKPFVQFWWKASWETVIWDNLKFGPVYQETMFKDFSNSALVPFCSAEPNHLCQSGRGHYGEHSC